MTKERLHTASPFRCPRTLFKLENLHDYFFWSVLVCPRQFFLAIKASVPHLHHKTWFMCQQPLSGILDTGVPQVTG